MLYYVPILQKTVNSTLYSVISKADHSRRLLYLKRQAKFTTTKSHEAPGCLLITVITGDFS